MLAKNSFLAQSSWQSMKWVRSVHGPHMILWNNQYAPAKSLILTLVGLCSHHMSMVDQELLLKEIKEFLFLGQMSECKI